MHKDVQLKIMIPPELKAEAAKFAVLDPDAKSLSHFIRMAIAEKINKANK